MNFEDVKRGYGNLFRRAKLRPEREQAALATARAIEANRATYEGVAADVGGRIPWWWIGAVHMLESGGSFKGHLHNGDPLSDRTTHVPAGRPPEGSPPFTWRQSAVDALLLKKLDKVEDWTVERCLWEWERYNGLGYFGSGINSPYLWSGTTLYEKGKYVADHKFDPEAVSKQVGAAAMLIALTMLGAVDLAEHKTSEDESMKDIKEAIADFAGIAPTLAAAAGGPLAGFAVRALADALGAPNASAPEIKDKIDKASLSSLIEAIKEADATIQKLRTAPAPDPAPVVVEVPPATPAAGPLDKALGGEFLKGWKTVIGGGLFTLVYVLNALHMFPTVLTPDVVQALEGAATFVAGAGLVAKIERWLLWLNPAPAVK